MIFNNNDLSSENIYDAGNDFQYDLNKFFSCFNENTHLTLSSMDCLSTCTGNYNVARGLNYDNNKRGICTYTCDMNCNNIDTYSTNCPRISLEERNLLLISIKKLCEVIAPIKLPLAIILK